MKKFSFLIVALAICSTLFAQHVTPLNITLVDFSLDSLRIRYADNMPMYRAELERIQDLQEATDKEMSHIRKELKDEKTYAKELTAYLKDHEKSLIDLQKTMEVEYTALTSIQQSAEKTLKRLQKTSLLNRDTRDSCITSLQTEKKEVIRMEDELATRQKYLITLLDRVRAYQAELSTFNTEILNKEVDLKQLEDTQKVRKASVKAELKNVKNALK